jgi:DNA-binding transcriptional LysR family regulator
MIKITVERALGSHIPDDVLRHAAEFGVLSYEPQEENLHSVVVYLDELVFVVPPRHPLATAGQVSIRQMGAESFVAHIVSSPYREKVIQLFKTHKTPLHMDLELPTLQAIKQFVAMGNGVALVPEISVETEIARGELVRIPVKELQLKRKLRLIYRKGANLSHAGRAFLKVAEAVAMERKGHYRFQREKWRVS